MAGPALYNRYFEGKPNTLFYTLFIIWNFNELPLFSLMNKSRLWIAKQRYKNLR